jgi:hypothetical protein
MSERPDKIVERIGRQRSIDPAVSFGQLRIVIPALNMTSSARARPIRRVRCWMPPAPGVTPVAASGWPKIADSPAAKRMSHTSTNSLPAPRTRPSICAMQLLGNFRKRGRDLAPQNH